MNTVFVRENISFYGYTRYTISCESTTDRCWNISIFHVQILSGVQWLSGRVLDSRPRGRGFEPHRRHCVVVLEQDTFILA